MEYTITLSDAENKALECIAIDPQKFIESMVYERCQIAVEDLFRSEIERISSEGGTISGTKIDIIMNPELKTVKQIEDERNLNNKVGIVT